MDSETFYLVFKVSALGDQQLHRTRSLDDARKYIFQRREMETRLKSQRWTYSIETRVATTTNREMFP